jgi:2-furoyl-CoA dehydrogenase large subunit
MSTPVCLANAVADALGVAELDLPLMPAKLAAHLHGPENEARRPDGARSPDGAKRHPGKAERPDADARGSRAGSGVPDYASLHPGYGPGTSAAPAKGRALHGRGEARVQAAPEAVWRMLLEPDTLRAIIPGCHSVAKLSATHFRADVTLGVGPVKGRYSADITLSALDPPRAVTLTGTVTGALGDAHGTGRIRLTPAKNGGTLLTYDYDAAIGGKAASVGGRLLDGAAKVVIRQFFSGLARQAGRPRGWFARLFRRGA